ncbi:hypothetical protein [Agarivorans gilvus]|nr:hypothetical protein [Agarivorans gilvus]
MEMEFIQSVVLLETGELLLVLKGGGKSMYQHIYRESAGVHWDKHLKGFKSTRIRKRSVSRWYSHILAMAVSGLSLKLELSSGVSWKGISESEKSKILSECAT